MSTKHTPGPWQVGPVFDNDGVPEIIVEHITPAGNLVVAVALGGLQGQEANARLIAAAPELLALLIRYRNETPLGHQPHMIAHKADAAIAKAGGAA